MCVLETIGWQFVPCVDLDHRPSHLNRHVSRTAGDPFKIPEGPLCQRLVSPVAFPFIEIVDDPIGIDVPDSRPGVHADVLPLLVGLRIRMTSRDVCRVPGVRVDAAIVSVDRFIVGSCNRQVVIAFDESGIGYTEIIGGAYQEDGTLAGGAYTQKEVIEAGFTYINGAAVAIWLFMLLMIILLPRKHSKKKIKKIAKTEAENVVDDEMANMMPAQRYAPPPPRGPRGGEGRRRRSDYDDDYDY